MKFIIKAFSLFAILLVFLIVNINPLHAAESLPDFNYLSVINSMDSKTNLYQQILDEMNLEYEHIGKREAARVLGNGTTSVTGGLNSIGFSYRRPFIDFSIAADRSLAPDLFDDKRWIVTDTFSIFIDASKLISNLKDRQVIDISDKNIGAFAGIVFKRTFTWIHFASSYQEGLTTRFDKLFLPFAALEFSKIANLAKNEMVFREDSLSTKAGGFVSAPIYGGISGSAGVLAKFEKMTRVEVVSSPGKKDANQDEIRISYEKSKSKSLGVSLAIAADFLNILKFTLLSYDLSYELTESYKIYLNFLQNDLREMNASAPVAREIKEVLKNKEGDLNVLAPYVISEEKKISQAINHKYNFFLLGGTKSSKTQQIEITTDGRVKNFFRHYYEKIKYTENFISRFFASFLYALTNSEMGATKLASDTKRVTIEYDSERNLLEKREDIDLKDDEQKLSMTFTAEFNTNKTTGLSGKKYLNRAIYVLERYSGIDPLAVELVKSHHLTAPFTITGQYQVNSAGISFFNSLQIAEVFDHLNSLCNEYPRNKFFNFRNLFDNCRRSLQNDYMDYFKDLSHDKVTSSVINRCEKKARKHIFSASKKRAALKNCLSQVTLKDRDDRTLIPLWSLKNFTNNIVNNSNSKVDYYNLFGVQNVFFYGNFSARTQDGRDFSTTFHEGEFKGFGVVDHFMRTENLRAPASVVVDQK